MDKKEIIGKTVINLKQERGLIRDINESGYIVVEFINRKALFGADAFEKGYLTFLDPQTNQKYTLELSEEAKKERANEINSCLNELNSLIGLAPVKETVKDLACQINIANLRRAYGLKCPEVTHHMVFVGNPGTGKTTVARIIAKIYKALGVLSKGQLVEVDRSSLVAGYQGQTAIKTKEAISSALGGVLFIDEAYALCRNQDDDYGYEALDTLTKAIDDYRNDLVVIVAGYRDEMNRFMNANPGLSSRFKTVIDFTDYNSNELYEIFKSLVKENDYILSQKASIKVRAYFKKYISLNGNGRTIRNNFEETLRYQSRRLDGFKEINKKLLMTIEPEDLIFIGEK